MAEDLGYQIFLTGSGVGTIAGISSTDTIISFKAGNETSYGALDLTSKGAASITLKTYDTDDVATDKVASLGALTTGAKNITVGRNDEDKVSLLFTTISVNNRNARFIVAKGGTVSASDVVTNSSGGTIEILTGGTFTANNAFNNNKNNQTYPTTLIITGGQFTGTGNNGFKNGGGSRVAITDGGQLELTAGDFTNYGTISVGASGQTEDNAINVLKFKNGASGEYAKLTVDDHGILTATSLTNEATNNSNWAATVEVKSGGTITVSGDVRNDSVRTTNSNDFTYGGMTVAGSFTAQGKFTNTGTLTVDSTGTLCMGGTLSGSYSPTSGNKTFTNTGTLTVDGNVYANIVENNLGGWITVDNGTLTATTITNKGGILKLTYNGSTPISSLTVTNPILNTVDDNTKIQGILKIDVSALDSYETGKYHRTQIANFTVAEGQDNSIQLVRGGADADDLDFEVVRTGTDEEKGIWIKETPTSAPTYLFVNAAWNGTRPTSISDSTYGTVSLTYSGTNRNAFYRIQDALDAAKEYGNCTIVFYMPNQSGGSLDFLSQGTVTIDTTVTFETNVAFTDKAVKLDSIHVKTGAVATFRTGFYSLEDYIDNNGTLKIVNTARFNANMIGNETGTVLIDTTARLIADAIEGGDIQLQIVKGSGSDKRINGLDPWILRPVGSIVDDPEVDIIVPDGSGTKTFIDVRSGDKLVRDSSGNYYIYRNGSYYSTLTGTNSDTPAPAPSGDLTIWDCTDQYKGLYLVNNAFDLKQITSGDDTDKYWSNTIYVDSSFNSETTSFQTENGKNVKAAYFSTTETGAGPSSSTGVYAFSSFVTAYNSTYATNHSIGKVNQGVVIRLRGSQSGDARVYDDLSQMSLTAKNDVIVEPDKTNGTDYDKVSLTLSGMSVGTQARLIEFSNLESLTLGGATPPISVDTSAASRAKNWCVGSENIKDANNKTTRGAAVLSFVNIGSLTLNGTLKAQGGATVRIVNCADVISNKHLSVAGGTLIIDSSNITLAGAFSDYVATGATNGVLSTENNKQGTGNIIVRNSTFKVQGNQSVAQGLYVNLKIGSEFMIEGMSTVSGVFTNADEVNSETTIAFSNATLDENTQILAGNPSKGAAALRFEGYNTLDGTLIEQAGNRDMTIESGASVNMSDGASITVGGGVNVQNCGNISLDNSSITAGSFDNTGSLTLTDGSTITLGKTYMVSRNGTKNEGQFTLTDLPVSTTASRNITVVVRDIDTGATICTKTVSLPKDTSSKTITASELYNSDSTKSYVGKDVFVTVGEGSITDQSALAQMGTLVNGENGTLSVDLHGDGGIGVAAGSITNKGLVQIDLSHTDYPASTLSIDIKGLSNSENGEVRIIGGGGNVVTNDGGSLSVQLNVPPMQTLYVNGGYDPDNDWNRGRNVGSFMYYGYNSFKYNPVSSGGDFQNLTFAGDTEKVVYVGGNSTPYGDLSIPTDVVRTITVSGTVYTRCTTKDTMVDSTTTYYAWLNGENVIYTLKKDGNGENGVDGANTYYFTSTIQTNGKTVASSTETAITIGTGDNARTYKRHAAKDETGYEAWKLQNGIAIVYTLSGSHGAGAAVYAYKDEFHDNGIAVASHTNLTDLTLTTLSGEAEMSALTVASAQTVTLSGATMSLNDNPDPSIVNSGTLNVGTGESAKLTIDVAKSVASRDVKVRIVGANGSEEYRTISVPAETGTEADNSTVVVKSDSFIVYQPYTVYVTDAHQCSYEDDRLAVEVKKDTDDRNVNIIIRNSLGVKYTYNNYSIGQGVSAVNLLTPASGSIGIVDGNENGDFELEYNQSTGQIILKAQQDVNATSDMTVHVSGLLTDSSSITCHFDYSFVVRKGHSYAAGDTIDDTVNTNFGAGYYYVEVEESSVSNVQAAPDSISGSVVTAENVTNSGTITVTSKDFGVEGNHKSAKLVLDVDKNSVDRWIDVAVTDDDATTHYSMYVAANEQEAALASEDFPVGKQYDSVTIKDVFTRTVPADDNGLTIDGLVGTAARTIKVTVKNGATTILDQVTVDVAEGVNTVILPSGFVSGTSYTVTVTDVRTVSNVEAQTLAEFTATAVTNTATINVADAKFTADSVVTNANTAHFNVEGTSELHIGEAGNGNNKFTGTITVGTTAAATLKDSAIYGGENAVINAQNNLTFTGTNALNRLTLDADGNTVTNNGTLTVDAASSVIADTVISSGDNKIRISVSDGDLGSGVAFRKVIDVETSDRTLKTAEGDGQNVLLAETPAPVEGAHLIQLDDYEDDVYVALEDLSTIYVGTGFSPSTKKGQIVDESGDEVAAGNYLVGYNAYSNFMTTLNLNVADEIVLKNGGDVVSVEDDIMLDATKSVTISGTGTVHLNANPSGTNNDLCLSARGTDTTITIGSGVTLDTTDSDARGNVWLDYYRNGGTIDLSGTINAKSQIWLGGNVTLRSTGKLDAGGQICFRAGYNGTTAKVSVTGVGNSSENTQITAAGALEFTSGKVETLDTYIRGASFVISDNHPNSDCALSVDSTNTTWEVTGNLTSGESGFKDTIELKANANGGSLLVVGGTANVGGLVTMTLTDSTMEVTGNMTNSGSVSVDKDSGTAALTAKAKLTNKGSISATDGATIGVTGSFTNGGVVLVLDDITAADTTQTYTVIITDAEEHSWSTTATLNRRNNTTDPVSLVADFGNQEAMEEEKPVIADGTYTVTVKNSSDETVKTYSDYSVRNASLTLSTKNTKFEGGAVTNKEGASIMVTDSDFEATSLENSGLITVSGENASLTVASGAKSSSGGVIVNYEDGVIEVDSSSEGLSARSLTNYGKVEITDSTATITSGVINGDERSPDASITITNSEFSASSITNEGIITVSSDTGKFSTLTVNSLSGNAIQAETGTLKNSTVGGAEGTVEVQDGATLTLTGTNSFTTLDLTGTYAAATMNWQNQLIFSNFTEDSDGKFAIDLTGFTDSTTGLITEGAYTKKVLDYNGSSTPWTVRDYKKLLGADKDSSKWSPYYMVDDDGDLWVQKPYTVYVSNAIPADGVLYFHTIDSAVAVAPSKIIVLDGAYPGDSTVIPQFCGITTEIQDPEGDGDNQKTVFSRAVYGGSRITQSGGSDSSPISRDIDVVISGGTFDKFFAGGNNINLPAAGSSYYVESEVSKVTITDGLFNKIVTGGDRFECGVTFVRKGDLTTEITGGTFRYSVAGGMIIAAAIPESDAAMPSATVIGDVYLKISGGNFTVQDDAGHKNFIYGGSISSQKQKNLTGIATINGKIQITVDSSSATSSDPITLCSIVVGSHGWGKVLHGTELVFKGHGGNALVINGELWGSSSGDSVDPITKKLDDKSGAVSEARILSFDAFNGALNCTDINAFSHAKFLNGSSVTLNNGGIYNLSGIENWTFENGSSIMDSNFKNDFDGDMLNLTGFDAAANYSGTLITDLVYDDDRDVFNGFSGLGIQFEGQNVAVTGRTDDTLTFSGSFASGSDTFAVSGTVSLEIVDSIRKMNYDFTVAVSA